MDFSLNEYLSLKTLLYVHVVFFKVANEVVRKHETSNISCMAHPRISENAESLKVFFRRINLTKAR